MRLFHEKRSFTLIELLVVIAVIAVLAGMLLPALGSTKEMAKTIQCASQIKQWNLKWLAYDGESNGFLPQSPLAMSGGFWYHTLPASGVASWYGDHTVRDSWAYKIWPDLYNPTKLNEIVSSVTVQLYVGWRDKGSVKDPKWKVGICPSIPLTENIGIYSESSYTLSQGVAGLWRNAARSGFENTYTRYTQIRKPSKQVSIFCSDAKNASKNVMRGEVIIEIEHAGAAHNPGKRDMRAGAHCRHKAGNVFNAGYADGHVESLNRTAVNALSRAEINLMYSNP